MHIERRCVSARMKCEVICKRKETKKKTQEGVFTMEGKGVTFGVDWPQHDVAITNIVWCIAYTGGSVGWAYIVQ